MQIKVAIIDNGVDKGCCHKLNISCLVDDDNSIKNEDGYSEGRHGTNCALIFDKFCNNTNLISIKILDRDGMGGVDKIEPALEWCYCNHIQLVNFSVGTTHFKDKGKIRSVINHFANKGMIIVAASANNGYMTYPATFTNVIGVIAGEKLGLNEHLQTHIGIDFVAPSEHEINQNEERIRLPKSNSYATPYITAMIGNYLKNIKCDHVSDIRKKIFLHEKQKRLCYVPDWIEYAWLSERCDHSDAKYYFYAIRDEYEYCKNRIDTIVICEEEYEKYHAEGKNIVYLGNKKE